MLLRLSNIIIIYTFFFTNHKQAYEAGHVVFFDFLGIYFFHYSETVGKSVNYVVAGAAVILIFVSLWRIGAVTQISISQVARWFTLVQIIQLVCLVWYCP